MAALRASLEGATGRSPLHPTPWSARRVVDDSAIFDADNVLVETVYGRPGDPNGEETSQRIVAAVNASAAASLPAPASLPGAGA